MRQLMYLTALTPKTATGWVLEEAFRESLDIFDGRVGGDQNPQYQRGGGRAQEEGRHSQQTGPDQVPVASVKPSCQKGQRYWHQWLWHLQVTGSHQPPDFLREHVKESGGRPLGSRRDIRLWQYQLLKDRMEHGCQLFQLRMGTCLHLPPSPGISKIPLVNSPPSAETRPPQRCMNG